MGLQGFEHRLESLVEGTFGRVFRSGLKPVEIGRRITRAMDDNRSVGVSGETIVPNQFFVYLNEEDHGRFAEVAGTLRTELEEAARAHARDEGYHFMGPVHVELEAAAGYPTGTMQVAAQLLEGPTGSPGSLVLPTGDRVTLADRVVTLGRLPECNIVLGDPNVSRNHAEIRPTASGYELVDLGATNGSRVNGIRVNEQLLADGDEIMLGSTIIRFEAS